MSCCKFVVICGLILSIQSIIINYQKDIYLSSVSLKHNLQGLIVSKGLGSCLNQISGFEPENVTKSIVSIIGPLFDPDM